MSKSMVLLPGVRSSRTMWWRAEQDLTELGCTVHALDLLGHGHARTVVSRMAAKDGGFARRIVREDPPGRRPGAAGGREPWPRA